MISDKQVTAKQKYKNLKRKLKLLLYEQECFMDELRKSERKMIKVQRDKNFLLDRLLQYERYDDSSGDSDSTMSSNESDSEFSHFNSRAPSSAKQERGSPAASGGMGAHFPFNQPSPTMLSSSMPGTMFANMHQPVQFAPNASMNGPNNYGIPRTGGVGPAVPTRGRGRPRAGNSSGVSRGSGGGGRGARGRGNASAAATAALSSVPTNGPPGTSGMSLAPALPKASGPNGNYSNAQQPQPPITPLGSPPQSGSMLSQGDIGGALAFPMFSPDNSSSGTNFLQQSQSLPPQQQTLQQQQQQPQRYTPQPGQMGPGTSQMNVNGGGGQQQQPTVLSDSMSMPGQVLMQPQQHPPQLPPGQQQQQQQAQQAQIQQVQTGQIQFTTGSQQQQQHQQPPQQQLMGPPQSQPQQQQQQQQPFGLPTQTLPNEIYLEGVMTKEDVDRCLESTTAHDELFLDRITGDLPADIFSENSEEGGVGGLGNSVSSEA